MVFFYHFDQGFFIILTRGPRPQPQVNPYSLTIILAGTRHLIIAVRGVISTFSWEAKIFFLFFNATGLLKNWKKQHFIICSNLTSFIIPFILFPFFSLFSLSSLFFFFFSFFFFFFSFFSFLIFPWGRRPPSPL